MQNSQCRAAALPRAALYRRTALDTSAIEQLGWKPQVSLKDGINRVLQFVNSVHN
jgi:nucleoside-diphosphate-sugar epimerase